MKVRDLVYETATALDANRGRSLLTVLGIVIGIAAVISMTALIGGVKQSMISGMGLTQARLVIISSYGDEEFTVEDMRDMESELARDYEFVTPAVFSDVDISSSTKSVQGGFAYGVEAEYEQVMNIKVKSGRFITNEDVSDEATVVVLDKEGVKTLFGSADADVVGQSVQISKAKYTVVGVVESGSPQEGASATIVYMPFSTCGKKVNGEVSLDTAYGMAREDRDMSSVADHTEAWMMKRLSISEDDKEDSLTVMTMESIIRELDAAMMSFQVLMTAVASISLVVGGIGIMNMMLTNVTERIREIGLRKALGARRRDITRQFLLESVCITLAGGIIGIAAGYAGAMALSGIAGEFFAADAIGESGMQIAPYLDPTTMLVVAGICVVIGIVFGYYPARRAAKLDPVESLRYQ